MDPSIEAIKQVDLAGFLSEHYGLEFQRLGAALACLSPFKEETHPSFFVRREGGHWLFKDFSAGIGGTIIDFVRMKEKIESVSGAISFIIKILAGTAFSQVVMESGDHNATAGDVDRGYDVEALYEKFRKEDAEVCRRYLLSREIEPALVEELISDGVVIHNRHQGRSYCSFAVRDETGRLQCIDNHEIEGEGKFVLGKKKPFTLEWDKLGNAETVFLAEGIIDYLSVKTLEQAPPPGLALLGNHLCFERRLLESAVTLLSAFDADRGGDSALIDLKALYPDKEIGIYDLEGHKDPNELLVAARTGKGRKLNPERKLQVFREFQSAPNKGELAKRWGIDRSHLYEIVRDCERTLLEAFSDRKPGRRPKGTPATLPDAIEQIKDLETRYEKEATLREELYCRSEFLGLRLKWAEIEAKEARGEKNSETGGSDKKPHVKKKKRKKR